MALSWRLVLAACCLGMSLHTANGASALRSTLPLAGARPKLSLDGEWAFRLDPARCGREERWFEPDAAFTNVIRIPGCWQAQGFGAPTANAKFSSVADGWHKKTFTIPDDWSKRREIFRVRSTH